MQFYEVFLHFISWMEQFTVQYGYLGFFIVSLIGAVSIFVPIPYTVIIFTFGGLFNPVLVALAAGTGAAIGELSGYLLGFYGRRLIKEDRRRKMEFMVKVFDRFGSLAIFLFALTPLPDDLLFIPLGMMRYDVFKAFVPALAGKMLMCFTLAYAGKVSNDIIGSIFGVGSDWIAVLFTAVLGIILLVIIMAVMLKIDWEEIFKKYFDKNVEPP